MARPGFATRDDLLTWADTVTSRTEFPRLIRRLVWETAPDAVRLGFPAGSGTSAGDWDGSVRTVKGNSFVPEGLSVWELSVEKNIARKVEGDYSKRAGTPDGSPAVEAEYIEVILRPWTGRQNWETEKRADGRWKSVRGYGVDDIEEWLETAPVTHSWISEVLGLAPHGYRAAESWWRRWVLETSPAVPGGVVLAGRDKAVEALESRLVGPPAITTIRGGSPEEIRAFIAAALERQADTGNSQWLSRAAFVDQVTSWRALIDRPGPMILVPTSDDVAAEAAPGAPHHVLIPVSSSSADIELPQIDARVAAAALSSKGLSDTAADDAGRLARVSLLSMRRSLAVKPELHTPPWASRPARALRGLLLAGRWNQDHEADRSAVTELTGGDYDTLLEMLADLARASDPFITRIGPDWMLVSPQDAWIQLRDQIRSDDLDRFKPIAHKVLLERDPALDLAPENRWYAGTVGKSPEHSGDLRRGLAVTLALLGIHGDVIDTGHGTTGRQRAAGTVRDLLRGATADTTGDLWNSLASALPLLAEAAPGAFLDGVREATTGSAPVISAMFTDSETAAVTAEPSRHHHLLWALERIAWSTEEFGRAIGLLARIAEVDPGGRTRNRPLNSLVSIFFLRSPGTSVTARERMAVIGTMRQRHPAVAWRLMMALLPSQFTLHDPTSAPEFRDWKPQEPVSVSAAEWLESIATLVDWITEDAGDDPHRWEQILQVLPFQPEPDRQRIRDALATKVTEGTLGEDGKAELREALRELIAHHRTRSGMQGALPAGELDALQSVDQELAPADPVQRCAWLFARQLPDLGNGRRFNEPEYNIDLREQRVLAVTEVENGGLDAVRQLAASAVSAWVVGACLAEATGDKDRDGLLALIPGTVTADEQLVEGWLADRFREEGWTWLDQLLAGPLNPEQAALALVASRDYPKAWQVADNLGVPVAEAFWRRFPINGLGSFIHATEASGRLAQVGRIADALQLAVIYLQHLAGDPVDLFTSLLSQFAEDYKSDPGAARLSEYDFQSVFGYLDDHADPQRRAEIAQLEWLFLPVLGFEPQASALYEALAADPEMFVNIMEAAWRASDKDTDEDDDQDDAAPSEDQQPNEAQMSQAQNAYTLLTSFDRLPGTGSDGQVDPEALKQWVDRVLDLAAASGRRNIAETLIGQILASAPADDEGTWPCQAVRDLLEHLQIERIERNLTARLYNQRGVTARNPEDGGEQERTLAEQYRAQATALSSTWPQTAAVLQNLASMYDTDAREEEDKAERFRQGQQK
jgi:hypothetical protein